MRLTRTRVRSSVSNRAAGRGRKQASSAATLATRAALRLLTKAPSQSAYAARLAKSRLPRKSKD